MEDLSNEVMSKMSKEDMENHLAMKHAILSNNFNSQVQNELSSDNEGDYEREDYAKYL